MNLEDRKKLLDLIKEDLADNPSLSVEYLESIKDGLLAFQDKEEQKRNILSDKAIHYMIDPQIVEKLEIPRTIHALAHQFPVGANWLSRSPLELSCLDVFYKKAKKYLKNNEDWLEIVNFIPWWNAVCKFMEDK